MPLPSRRFGRRRPRTVPQWRCRKCGAKYDAQPHVTFGSCLRLKGCPGCGARNEWITKGRVED